MRPQLSVWAPSGLRISSKMVRRLRSGDERPPAPSQRRLDASRRWAWDHSRASAEWLRTLLPIAELRRKIALNLFISYLMCDHRFDKCLRCGFHCCVFCKAKYYHAWPMPHVCVCVSHRQTTDELILRMDRYEASFAVDVPSLHFLYPHHYEGLYARWAHAHGWCVIPNTP